MMASRVAARLKLLSADTQNSKKMLDPDQL